VQTRERAAVQTRLAEHQEPPTQTRAVPAAERGHPGRAASVRVRAIGDLRAAITDPRLSRASGTLFALQRALSNRALREAMSRARQASGPAPVAQPRLVIGPADDRYERAADRIAREAGRRVAQQPTGQGGPRCSSPTGHPADGDGQGQRGRQWTAPGHRAGPRWRPAGAGRTARLDGTGVRRHCHHADTAGPTAIEADPVGGEGQAEAAGQAGSARPQRQLAGRQ
jgi:hypothetical protein